MLRLSWLPKASVASLERMKLNPFLTANISTNRLVKEMFRMHGRNLRDLDISWLTFQCYNLFRTLGAQTYRTKFWKQEDRVLERSEIFVWGHCTTQRPDTSGELILLFRRLACGNTHWYWRTQELNYACLCRNPKTNHHSQPESITMYHIVSYTIFSYLYITIFVTYVKIATNRHKSKSLMLEVDDPDETVASGTSHSAWRCKGQLRDHPRGKKSRPKWQKWQSKRYLELVALLCIMCKYLNI